jgi:hypothetical protein
MFTQLYGAKFPKAVKKITDDAAELLAFYDFPAEHWIRRCHVVGCVTAGWCVGVWRARGPGLRSGHGGSAGAGDLVPDGEAEGHLRAVVVVVSRLVGEWEYCRCWWRAMGGGESLWHVGEGRLREQCRVLLHRLSSPPTRCPSPSA